MSLKDEAAKDVDWAIEVAFQNLYNLSYQILLAQGEEEESAQEQAEEILRTPDLDMLNFYVKMNLTQLRHYRKR